MYGTFQKRLQSVLLVTLAMCTVFFVALFDTNGWLTLSGVKTGDTDTLTVEDPPILYVLDSDAEDITQLSLSGLEIGVDKQIVFCISSVYPVESDSDEINISFNLELAYTRNLGASFDLYNADIVPTKTADAIEYVSQTGTIGYFEQGSALTMSADSLNVDTNGDGTNDSYSDSAPLSTYSLRVNGLAYKNTDEVQPLNYATYKQYITSSDPVDPNYTLCFIENTPIGTGPLYNTLKCRFFILNISWDAEHLNKKEVEKETDLVYIIARGGSALE